MLVWQQAETLDLFLAGWLIFRISTKYTCTFARMKILIVEDEKELAGSMVIYLQSERYLCECTDNVNDALTKIESFDYDCVLLDITIIGGSGFTILKALKANNKMEGVIILSAKGSIDDKIKGLQLGADDYLSKPFHLSELSARIAAVIRRKYFGGNNTISIHNINIDLIAKTVAVQDTIVDLTKSEYDLLLYLASNKNRVVSKNAIAEHLSGEEADYFGTYDFLYAHMKNLKRKLQDAGFGDYLKAVYGMGYKLQA